MEEVKDAKKELMEKLQAPFGENELEFRVGSTNRDKTMGMALPYISARAIQNRLDEVFGIEGWQVEYQEVNNGYLCKISVCIDGKWISKQDGCQFTQFEPLKGALSGAFKRAAAAGLGIGRYLYDIEPQWCPIRPAGKSFAFVNKPSLNPQQNQYQQDQYQQQGGYQQDYQQGYQQQQQGYNQY